jgi:peptidyl-prolyl cis-trans isomerase SurA
MLRVPVLAVIALTLIFTIACKTAVPENVAATVNTRTITYADLDKQFLSQFSASADKASDDQMMIQKLEVLRNLIDSEIMLQRAEKLGLMATDTDVEAKITEFKSPFTQEEFQKQLAARKMSLDDLKAQLKRELSVQKLINKEITSHISISDKDVSDFYNSNKTSFNFPEPQIHMAQIVVTPQPDANVRNLKNDKAQTDDQAQKKVHMLEARVHQGEDFGMLAQNFSEDPQSSPNGGDLGFVPESALEKAGPDVRKILNIPPGQVSPIIKTDGGYRMFKIFSREPAGQRALSDPRVQQSIRETLLNRKDQLLRAAYFEVARDEAKVVNYLGQTITKTRIK